MYKIIFTDLDGTLLKDDNTLSKENYNAIHKAFSMGISTVVCSGRSHMSLDNIITLYGLPKTYTIGFNGGIIYYGKEIIDCVYLDEELAAEILEHIKSIDCQALMYRDNNLWIEKETPETVNYAKRSYLEPIVVKNLKENISENINKIIILGENHTLKHAEKYLKKQLDNKVSVVFSSNTLLEFNPKDTNKGTALKKLSEYLNIPIEETMSFGDSYNDIEMLETAGLGIAMANSPDDVKNKSDYVTLADNNNNGVAEAINKFIFGGKQND